MMVRIDDRQFRFEDFLPFLLGEPGIVGPRDMAEAAGLRHDFLPNVFGQTPTLTLPRLRGRESGRVAGETPALRYFAASASAGALAAASTAAASLATGVPSKK